MKIILSLVIAIGVGIGGWCLIKKLNTPTHINDNHILKTVYNLDSMDVISTQQSEKIHVLKDRLDSLRKDTIHEVPNDDLKDIVNYLKNLK